MYMYIARVNTKEGGWFSIAKDYPIRSSFCPRAHTHTHNLYSVYIIFGFDDCAHLHLPARARRFPRDAVQQLDIIIAAHTSGE